MKNLNKRGGRGMLPACCLPLRGREGVTLLAAAENKRITQKKEDFNKARIIINQIRAEMAVRVLNKVGKTIKRSNVLIMGLTYKEDVADIRESPAGNIVQDLKQYNVDVYGYDPLLPESAIRHFSAKPLQNLDKKMDAVIIAAPFPSFTIFIPNLPVKPDLDPPRAASERTGPARK
jgi:UDP-N-acetyl-D-mannosaminuronate dehydrogenase